MSKSIQLKNSNNEKMYPHPYYPIGSIYLSVNNANPSQWFGGTWEQIAKGRTLVGVDTGDTDFNTVKKTGGEKTHTLSIDEMPKHNHQIAYDQTSGSNTAGVKVGVQTVYTWSSTPVVQYAGGSQAHNNLQPYFTCYIWCRTA
jgi:hypothetical protein